MKSTEFTSKFDPLLIEFWQGCSPKMLNFYMVQNNCHEASLDFNTFLIRSKGTGYGEIIRTGEVINGKRVDGWIRTDLPDTHIDALTDNDFAAMKAAKLKPHSQKDRLTYINSSPEIFKEFCNIPHSWVELKGVVLDPSGFYLDGKSGQFDKFVKDKSNLPSRYTVY